MSTEQCTHANRIPAKMELDLTRPSESKIGHSTPVNILICRDCGRIELFAALPDFLCAWLLKEQ
jgi:hypothetical protein